MKRIKYIVLGGMVLVVLLIGGLFMYIDVIAKGGVERGATYALDVDTTLGGMDVGVLGGSVDMDNLNIHNPSGFDEPSFLELGSGRVGVSLGTLMEDKIVLPEITFKKVRLSLENKGGKKNYQAILDGLKKFESKEKQAPQASEGGKKFVCHLISIEDVIVTVDLLPFGGGLTRIPVEIDKIELRNVGSDSAGGVEMAELTSIIVKAILKAVVDRAGHLLPADIAGELTAGLRSLEDLGAASVKVVGEVTKGAEEFVKGTSEELRKTSEELRKSGEELQKSVGEAGKELDKAAKDLQKGLGGLLGEKKEEKR